MGPRTVARVLAAAGILAVSAIALTAVWMVALRPSRPARAVQVAPKTLLRAQDFRWTQMKGDQKHWELVAREASYSDDKTSLKLVGTELSMVLDDGRPLKLIAPRAELKLDGNHVNRAELTGGLQIEYGKVILTTSDAVYLPDQDELKAPGLVQIKGEGVSVSGVGLEARPRARTFELEREVNTELTPGPAGGLSKGS